MSNDKEAESLPQVVEDKSKKNSVKDIFSEYSQPIGLILLGVFAYLEFGQERDVNDLYLWICGALLAGPDLVKAYKK